jgi:hypothetical protein
MRMTRLMGRWGVGAGLGVLLQMASPGQATSQSWCNDSSSRGDRDHVCEVREVTLSPSSVLRVDGGENGGVSIIGWNEDEILVRARIRARAGSESDAQSLAEAINVLTSDGYVRTEGPRSGRRESWSVSFEIFTPFDSNLDLQANNGGISISDVRGDIEFRTRNGGVHLTDLAGDVRGRTQNGGLKVELAGDRWDGSTLDVETQNGGVTIDIPRGYSADFETGTVNGSIDLAFPIMVSGRLKSRIRTTLGDGGPAVRVVTTNGGVKVRQTGTRVR